MPARRSPDGALVPPENRCPASGFPVSRAQMPNPMPKCRCDQGVKHALCGALRDEAQLGREPRRPRSPSAAVVLHVAQRRALRELQRRHSNPASGKGPRAGALPWRDPRGASPTAPRQLLAPCGSPQSRAALQKSGGRASARPRAVGSPAAAADVGSEGRQLLLRFRCDPGIAKRVAASGDGAETLDGRHRPQEGRWAPHSG
ncbi:hypothetical protein NDU88_004048 [Pleurodeles waltl]|uniref:Uncharacterized protein n=1 Tax=Pleurodeles waltl TaxID=8319 RepID=A0AAV7T7P3_PLEWA|nr:hypothetical protein NDU88_004048 [Pleurodeles waltl]